MGGNLDFVIGIKTFFISARHWSTRPNHELTTFTVGFYVGRRPCAHVLPHSIVGSGVQLSTVVQRY
jgi:hypothetical protein